MGACHFVTKRIACIFMTTPQFGGGCILAVLLLSNPIFRPHGFVQPPPTCKHPVAHMEQR